MTQKTAWFMLHRIREAMHDDDGRMLKGIVESDETFIGGAFKNMHKSKREKMPSGRGTVGKTIVHGILDRGEGAQPSQVRVNVVPNQKRKTLHAKIEQHVKTGAVIYTDKLASYEGLDWGYFHDCVDHAVEYVRGEVHTNGMENFWSLLKRMLGGTYVSVAPKHLVRYCAEEAFRFNKRKGDDAARFKIAMANTPGKRLTYRELASKA